MALHLLLLEDRTVPAPMGLLVPAYFYPTPAASGGSPWDQLNTAASQVPITAIMNPDSGPGAQFDPNYQTAVDNLHTAGGKVIGYVHTSYAKRSLYKVEAEINHYRRWYHLDGIFVDEMTSDASTQHLRYYQAIDNYVHRVQPGWTVVGNPGTIPTTQAYAKVADTLVLFEADGANYGSYAPPSWQTSSPASGFANILYNVSSKDIMQADVRQAASNNTGWIYVTDANLPNPYGGLPTSYWSDLVTAVEANNPSAGPPTTFFVSPTGNDANPGTFVRPFQTIQNALKVANLPGDTIEVRAGTYHEKISFPHSGSASGGFITLEAFPGEHPVLDGTGVHSSDVGYGNDMVQMINVSYVQISGFTIQNVKGTAVVDASGIHVEGAGSNIDIFNNVITAISGVHGMGISVYGSSQTSAISQLTIDGNLIYNCRPADSETITLNGNVNNFQITNNVIHDCNNIGIDMIGGEYSIFGLTQPTLNLPVTSNGVCIHNTVYNIHAAYGGGFAAGIYVDGGQNITVADNVSYQNDMGLEVGAENPGYTASGIVVENNILYNNTKAGLVFGGYNAKVGQVQNCSFINNTVYNNDTHNTGNGQLWIQWASNNIVTNNIFVSSANGVLIGGADAGSNVSNTLDYNLYFTTPGKGNGTFNWNGLVYSSFADYQTGTKQTGTAEDAHSLFADPQFMSAVQANFQLQLGSPAINSGSSSSGQFAPLDFNGKTRGSPPDIGAF